jgi:hypothetical protein
MSRRSRPTAGTRPPSGVRSPHPTAGTRPPSVVRTPHPGAGTRWRSMVPARTTFPTAAVLAGTVTPQRTAGTRVGPEPPGRSGCRNARTCWDTAVRVRAPVVTPGGRVDPTPVVSGRVVPGRSSSAPTPPVRSGVGTAGSRTRTGGPTSRSSVPGGRPGPLTSSCPKETGPGRSSRTTRSRLPVRGRCRRPGRRRPASGRPPRVPGCLPGSRHPLLHGRRRHGRRFRVACPART